MFLVAPDHRMGVVGWDQDLMLQGSPSHQAQGSWGVRSMCGLRYGCNEKAWELAPEHVAPRVSKIDSALPSTHFLPVESWIIAFFSDPWFFLFFSVLGFLSGFLEFGL